MYGEEMEILTEEGLRIFGDLRYPCYTLSLHKSLRQRNTVRIFVSISELTVGVHIWSIINTHTCHLRLMLLSICELRYPESMDNIHMTRTSKSSTW